MECPICRNDKRMHIDETRHNKETNETMRRYVCVDCGREFYAIDMLVRLFCFEAGSMAVTATIISHLSPLFFVVLFI